VDIRRIASLMLASTLSASLCVASAGPVVAARPGKSASLDAAFTVRDGRCYLTETATWTGYQVNHIRFLGYVEGHSGMDYGLFDTQGYPKGESHASGSMTSTAFAAARPGEGWYGYALFRSNGGARLAEVTTAIVYAPADCLYP